MVVLNKNVKSATGKVSNIYNKPIQIQRRNISKSKLTNNKQITQDSTDQQNIDTKLSSEMIINNEQDYSNLKTIYISAKPS